MTSKKPSKRSNAGRRTIFGPNASVCVSFRITQEQEMALRAHAEGEPLGNFCRDLALSLLDSPPEERPKGVRKLKDLALRMSEEDSSFWKNLKRLSQVGMDLHKFYEKERDDDKGREK